MENNEIITTFEMDYKKSWENSIAKLYHYEKEIEKLKRQIKIKDKWCQLIIDIGFDYDGYNDSENLKGIIDELVGYARNSINNDDTTCATISGEQEKQWNILGEEIDDNRGTTDK